LRLEFIRAAASEIIGRSARILKVKIEEEGKRNRVQLRGTTRIANAC
jgi:Holliday junction resolvasome RuvABC ATP-dependent DNA helicase subunit